MPPEGEHEWTYTLKVRQFGKADQTLRESVARIALDMEESFGAGRVDIIGTCGRCGSAVRYTDAGDWAGPKGGLTCGKRTHSLLG